MNQNKTGITRGSSTSTTHSRAQHPGGAAWVCQGLWGAGGTVGQWR